MGWSLSEPGDGPPDSRLQLVEVGLDGQANDLLIGEVSHHLEAINQEQAVAIHSSAALTPTFGWLIHLDSPLQPLGQQHGLLPGVDH